MTRLEAAEQYIRLHDVARELGQVGWAIPDMLVRDMGEAEFMYNLLSAGIAVPEQRVSDVFTDRGGNNVVESLLPVVGSGR